MKTSQIKNYCGTVTDYLDSSFGRKQNFHKIVKGVTVPLRHYILRILSDQRQVCPVKTRLVAPAPLKYVTDVNCSWRRRRCNRRGWGTAGRRSWGRGTARCRGRGCGCNNLPDRRSTCRNTRCPCFSPSSPRYPINARRTFCQILPCGRTRVHHRKHIRLRCTCTHPRY